jgi:hypothetical protein
MRTISSILSMACICLAVASLSAQNVGINTLFPAAALDVQSSGNSSATMAVSVSNSGNDTLVVVRDNGNVGIGTTQPGVPLDVQTQGNLAARFSAPVEGQPAVNTNELVTLGQLQAVSAGGSSSGSSASNASMWSTSFTTTVNNFATAVIYCRNLTDGGFTDWRVPNVLDILKLLEDSSVPLPSYGAGAYYWMSVSQATHGSISWPIFYIANANLNSNNSFFFNTTSSSSNDARAFCVR